MGVLRAKSRRIRGRELRGRHDGIVLQSARFEPESTSSEMRVDRHVSSGSAQTLSLSVWNMLFTMVSGVETSTYVFGSLYCLAIPKSTTWMVFAPLVAGRPIKKLSGLISR